MIDHYQTSNHFRFYKLSLGTNEFPVRVGINTKTVYEWNTATNTGYYGQYKSNWEKSEEIVYSEGKFKKDKEIYSFKKITYNEAFELITKLAEK